MSIGVRDSLNRKLYTKRQVLALVKTGCIGQCISPWVAPLIDHWRASGGRAAHMGHRRAGSHRGAGQATAIDCSMCSVALWANVCRPRRGLLNLDVSKLRMRSKRMRKRNGKDSGESNHNSRGGSTATEEHLGACTVIVRISLPLKSPQSSGARVSGGKFDAENEGELPRNVVRTPTSQAAQIRAGKQWCTDPSDYRTCWRQTIERSACSNSG
jgi:hypothetical protein